MKYIQLPTCNLLLTSIGLDKNGNSKITVKFLNDNRGFSIQLTGNLPKTKRILRGISKISELDNIPFSRIKEMSKEICAYVKNYGSVKQKRRLRIY